MNQYQPRFLAWVASLGSPPTLPPLYEFMAWIRRQWHHWRAATGYKGEIAEKQHADFDRWLAERHGVPSAAVGRSEGYLS